MPDVQAQTPTSFMVLPLCFIPVYLSRRRAGCPGRRSRRNELVVVVIRAGLEQREHLRRRLDGVQLLREAGAKEVHFRSSSPKFLYPCYFGTDVNSREHLIAAKHTTEEIAQIIGVDSLGYLELSDLERIPDNYHHGICNACFSGEYPLDVSGAEQVKHLGEQKLSPEAGKGNA